MEAYGNVASASGQQRMSSWGEPAQFHNKYCEGSACLVHRPPAGLDRKTSEIHDVLEISGPPTASWELQIQVKFKVVPVGTVWCGFELRQGQLKLGGISRLLARTVLTLAQATARQRGAELRYTLGDDSTGEAPHIAVPIMAAYRMFRSEARTALPVTHPGKKGTWHLNDGQWLPVERTTDFLDTSHYFTMIFNTANLDWHLWNIINVPAIGAIDLAHFCGRQACYSVLYDDGSQDQPWRRHFVEVEWVPPHARRCLDADRAAAAAAATRDRLLEAAADATSEESLEEGPGVARTRSSPTRMNRGWTGSRPSVAAVAAQ